MQYTRNRWPCGGWPLPAAIAILTLVHCGDQEEALEQSDGQAVSVSCFHVVTPASTYVNLGAQPKPDAPQAADLGGVVDAQFISDRAKQVVALAHQNGNHWRATCTGIVIGRRHILTNDHCSLDSNSRAYIAWVGGTNPSDSISSFVGIKQRVERGPVIPGRGGTRMDYAIWEVEQDLVDAGAVPATLLIRDNGFPQASVGAAILGHAGGNNMTVATGTYVVHPDQGLSKGSDVAHNIPTIGGFSGSPIFNTNHGAVEALNWGLCNLNLAADDSDPFCSAIASVGGTGRAYTMTAIYNASAILRSLNPNVLRVDD